MQRRNMRRGRGVVVAKEGKKEKKTPNNAPFKKCFSGYARSILENYFP